MASFLLQGKDVWMKEQEEAGADHRPEEGRMLDSGAGGPLAIRAVLPRGWGFRGFCGEGCGGKKGLC